MSTLAIPATVVTSMAHAPSAPRSVGVIVDDRIFVPAGVDDLESYRAWAHSADFPQSGWVSYLNGLIWVDPNLEEFLTHNRVRTAYTVAVVNSRPNPPDGCFVSDRMLLTNAVANLSTEPDGLFYSWSTMKEGRLRLVPGKKHGFMELDGSPDMILEIISESSVRKDREVLRELYWKAGITEYWLVDARTEPAQFDILRHTALGYQQIAAVDGWLKSEVLGREFRLVRQTDPLGHPQFIVEIR